MQTPNHKSLAEQIGNWCRHFNGIDRGTCKAGVRYIDIKGVEVASRTYPCFKDNNCADRCPSASFLSAQEVVEEVKRSQEIAARFLTELAEGKTCPHCHAPITKRYQVGRCVYAKPCGHRQYQGKLTESEHTSADTREMEEASIWDAFDEEEE